MSGCAYASTTLAHVIGREEIPVVAGGAIWLCGVRASTCARNTRPDRMALVAGAALDSIATCTRSALARICLRAGISVIARSPIAPRTPRGLAGNRCALLALVDWTRGASTVARPTDQAVSGRDRVGAGPVAVASVDGAGKSIVAAIGRPAAGARRALVVAGASISVVARGPVGLRTPGRLAGCGCALLALVGRTPSPAGVACTSDQTVSRQQGKASGPVAAAAIRRAG